MTNEMAEPERVIDLAEDQWGYVHDLLRTHGEIDRVIDKCKFHFVTAYIQGYNKAVADSREMRRREDAR